MDNLHWSIDRPLGWPQGLTLAATKVGYDKPFYIFKIVRVEFDISIFCEVFVAFRKLK
jgi:hypothetical protein